MVLYRNQWAVNFIIHSAELHIDSSCYIFKRIYNPFLVYCCELAPGTVSLTGDRAQGDDSKHDSH